MSYQYDTSKITARQYGSLHNPAFLSDDDYKILAAVVGMEVDKLMELPMSEINAILFGLIEILSHPLANPR